MDLIVITDLDVESATQLKKVKRNLVLVLYFHLYIHIDRYMFSVWFGLSEIDVDLLVSWWLWRRYKGFYRFIAF